MDEEARFELAAIINQISQEDRRAIAEMPEGHVTLLHHGLGASIRNRIRSGELKALFCWSCKQVLAARALDDRAWPIVLEVWNVVRSQPGDEEPQSFSAAC
jgi:hypothetical protein